MNAYLTRAGAECLGFPELAHPRPPGARCLVTEKKPDDWTRGALYGLSLACRLGSADVAKEGLGAMGISTIAELEASGADEYDLAPLRFVLWREGDKPAEPEAGAWMVAHDSGDGWYLSWTNDDGDELAEIPWPFGDSEIDAAEMERLGFEVV